MIAVWVAFGIATVVIFAGLETFSIKTGRPTLSRTVWIASKAFPLLPFLVGMLAGGLAVHFWWGGIVCFAPV